MSGELGQIALTGYLISAALFILGLKGLSRPRTAVRGNLQAASAMLLAIIVTLVDAEIVGYTVIAAGLAVGIVIGSLLATRVRMTGMPQLVALFNGFGGGASMLIGAASFLVAVDSGVETVDLSAAAAFTVAVGAITFTGSVIAFAKLQELLAGGTNQQATIKAFNVGGLLIAIGLAVMMVTRPSTEGWMWGLVAVGLVLGITAVMPIGGADMPVVIAILNSFSGLAAAATGFVLDNSLLIVAGSLVGASGLILTQIMCNAMNRTLFSVVFGAMASSQPGPDADEVYAGRVRSASAEEVAMLLEGARRVAIIPGYGLAVAQAQHAVRDLARSLEGQGTDVVFAIHPVAGRMPGHMNVLLAEAEVPYDQLAELEVVNPTFEQIDVAIVIGANDVVNPSARTDPESPIAGMPILDVDKARVVVVIKRSLSPGFAGIPNPLFAADNTVMLYGDGREAVVGITTSLASV
ncbi:MAG: NAD(P)(+) transhydrogenase (Re/Si-specific) subunit beta [Actinomycetia bacterium]|nr:NAD(P)(+) transhydrogenase (Re/Si-specific) subunit beta [Actinomycetes bacterium]